jgi:hypothetical protein
LVLIGVDILPEPWHAAVKCLPKMHPFECSV